MTNWPALSQSQLSNFFSHYNNSFFIQFALLAVVNICISVQENANTHFTGRLSTAKIMVGK